MTWFDEYEGMSVDLSGFDRNAPQYQGVGLLRSAARYADAERKRTLQQRRGGPVPHEWYPPRGQAAGWYEDVQRFVPRSGVLVAHALARLCDLDSVVTISHRSLADAVGRKNAAGYERSFTQRGVECLVDAGWLKVEARGRGRGAVTTYYLMPGDLGADEALPGEWLDLDDEDNAPSPLTA